MRILFVAFPHSVHTARWINQITDRGWDVHLAPSIPAPLYSDLKGKVTFHGSTHPRQAPTKRRFVTLLKWWPHHRGSGYVRRLLEHLDRHTTEQGLDRIVHKIKPDIVHSMEIQQAGYLTFETRKRMGNNFPTWVVSNWGSDVYLFGRLAAHRERVKQVLALCDYYACECERDVALAKQFGLKGQVLPVLPCGGGFDLERLKQFRQPGPPSTRRIVLIKGYQNWAGRALVALQAIEMCADLLQGYRVLIQLASPEVEIAAELVSQSTGIPIEIAPAGEYENAMRRFGAARIHVGLSISDGISQSLIESMVMGAFPIQSCTACANEWIENGKSGFLVPPEDPYRVAEALRCALTDDHLVDQAAILNAETAQQRLAYAHVKGKVVEMYNSIFAAPVQ